MSQPAKGYKSRRAGRVAAAGETRLRSYTVGAVPILNRFFERLSLSEILERHLPREDERTKVPTSTAILLLVQNVLISREPIYGVGEWASSYAPDLFGFSEQQLSALNDDRLGRALGGLFAALGPELILDVVRQAMHEFHLRLDELHNDSTSVSFYGNYPAAATEGARRGRATHAITWGHSKDHRPDLKQLLYILTVTEDGGVPVYFTSASGNVNDDLTHTQTWDLMCQLVGRPDFLYVADCKLASIHNLDHLTRRGGRFVTVLPASRREDREFRRQLSAPGTVPLWKHLYNVTQVKKDQQGKERTVVVDRVSVWEEEWSTSEGYRLLWYHRTRKAEYDRAARQRRTEEALAELAVLRQRMAKPKTRFREHALVDKAVAEILSRRQVEPWVKVRVEVKETEFYHQTKRGRPSTETRYVREVQTRFDLAVEVDAEQLQREAVGDGVFPLLTNDRQMNAEAVVRAYKRQPLIEKRFSQFKTDFAVAPVYLKEVSRIQGLLGVYFLALLVQTLLEREVRRAMKDRQIEHLPLYAEERPCRWPTARKLLDLFEPVQRHELNMAQAPPERLITELSPLQRSILSLLAIPAVSYGQSPAP
jgi:transposase